MISLNVYLSDKDYKKVTASVPIICVDIVLFNKEENKLGFIRRGTKHALIGGRIGLGESIDEAIKRHLANDVGISEFKYYKCYPQKPVLIHEYDKAKSSENEKKRGFDPTKHSIGLTYILATNQDPVPANEATDFKWAEKHELERIDFDFGQKSVVGELFNLV
ncbi:MAG TPA: DUF4916 domain-containing protein [Patescibacteria group bacterium]|nr:DUF4916 domain-containing protein [Patescibacteria group bacterium]